MRISMCRMAMAFALFLLPCAAWAQSAPQPECSLPTPVFVTGAPNIFNDQQEQYLGDALAEFFESDMRIAPPAADDELTRIGEKLLATLPPTGVHYTFRIYDSGEINGFSLAGGHVYISRKMVTAVKDEDELAGVLAHEIGHISTHQSAIDFTRFFRVRLGVTQVTDRADVFARVHQFFNTPEKEGEELDKEKADQLIADHVALYAMVRAGYAPGSFASFLDQSTMNKGKTGNWLSDAFGLTHEDSERYRSALKLISVLPAGCKNVQPSSSAEFTAWLRGVVEERTKDAAENATGDRPLKLDPPLRSSLWHIRFSLDGRYVLGQDDGGIAVVDRAAAKILFRIDAPYVEAAQFTPDSQSVVFKDSKLRVERWNIASGKRASVKEMVVFDGCDQSLLTPDGNTLVCANFRKSESIDLRLIDVESGKPFFDKPSFYQIGAFTPESDVFTLVVDVMSHSDFARMLISPDGRYLVVTAFTSSMAYDFEHRQPVGLSGKLSDLAPSRASSFLGADQMFVVGEAAGEGLYKARVLSFPDGHVVQESELGNQFVLPSSKGRTLIAGPLKDYAVGILDPDKHHFVAASKLSAIDAWDDTVAMEGGQGELIVAKLGGSTAANVVLPVGILPDPRAAAFSPDGKYLAVSLKNRADLWDLETGKQLSLIRPLTNAWFDEDDHLFAQLPKYADKDPAELEMVMNPVSGKMLGKFETEDWQYRNLQIRFKPLGKDKNVTTHATLEVKKMESQAVAWSRDYPHESPACWPAEDNRLVLAWDLSNDTAKSELKKYPVLQREAAALKKKGMLLETVVPDTGAPLQQVVVPEADLTEGTDDVRRATVSGDVVLAKGEHGDTAIYSIQDGSKIGEFFGAVLATDAQSGVIAAKNREDEMFLVDEHTGKELERFQLGSPIRLARIVAPNEGAGVNEKTLLVLTADQIVHRLPLPK